MAYEGTRCAARDEIRAFAANPLADGMAGVAEHVFACERCQRAFEEALYPSAESALTDGERAAIALFVAARCPSKKPLDGRLRDFVFAWNARLAGDVGEWRLAAAPRGASAAAPARGAGGEPVVFVFASDGDAGDVRAWRAEMTVPADAKADTPLRISVAGRDGGKVAAGVFRIAGVALPVADGKAALPFGMFLSGMKDSAVALKFPDGSSSRGSLVFF